MWQAYYTPHTIDEALQLLAEHQAAARLIAGGTDLVIEMERGLRSTKVVIDISRLPNLDTITQDEGDPTQLGFFRLSHAVCVGILVAHHTDRTGA